jgi:hypothetical protein
VVGGKKEQVQGKKEQVQGKKEQVQGKKEQVQGNQQVHGEVQAGDNLAEDVVASSGNTPS